MFLAQVEDAPLVAVLELNFKVRQVLAVTKEHAAVDIVKAVLLTELYVGIFLQVGFDLVEVLSGHDVERGAGVKDGILSLFRHSTILTIELDVAHADAPIVFVVQHPHPEDVVAGRALLAVLVDVVAAECERAIGDVV